MAGVDVRISELPAATEGHPDDRFETTQVDGATLVSRSITLELVSDAVAAVLPPPVSDWDSITGKPATFPPTLPIPESGVTNLVSDLAGKAPVSHSHTAGDLPPYPTSLPPSGTAGGDLTGTYPNPLIKPSVTNGQVLTTVAGAAAWAAASGGSGAATSVGTTPPASPTDGQLWYYSDATNGGGQLYIRYNDGNSTAWVLANPSAVSVGAVSRKFTRFTVNGTWTPDPKLLYGEIRVKGGGGGGSSSNAPAGWSQGGAGGGEGAMAIVYFNAGSLAASYAVTIGAVVGPDVAGNASSVGTLCVANGGAQGAGITGGAGGSTGTGDEIIPGAPGGSAWMNTLQANEYAVGGSGGGTGGGPGAGATGGVGGTGGFAILNSGGGGGGAASRNAGNVGGGNGASGCVTIIEYLKG